MDPLKNMVTAFTKYDKGSEGYLTRHELRCALDSLYIDFLIRENTRL